MAISLGRVSVQEENCFHVFFERMDGKPEEIHVELLDEAPTGGDIVVVCGVDE